ncbi:30S ribosomal protein S8e [Candidatus Micrarchaeota archaeon]|nr:30S ribosomal protein S8e [Candidatus Micrarchaeota archaeon]
MVQYHKSTKSKQSGSGGKKKRTRDKVLAHYGGFFSRSKVAKEGQEKSLKKSKVTGGSVKVHARTVVFANVSDGKTVKKAKILTVVESPDNRHFARENLLTRGCLIETELGKARVTSRPGQSGIVNATLQK